MFGDNIDQFELTVQPEQMRVDDGVAKESQPLFHCPNGDSGVRGVFSESSQDVRSEIDGPD